MKSNFLSNKLEELYAKEQYKHPIQTKTKPDVSITGEKPDEEQLNQRIFKPKVTVDDDDSTKDLGDKGNQKDLGNKGSKEDIGTDKKSDPKEWDFEGPRVSIKQEN